MANLKVLVSALGFGLVLAACATDRGDIGSGTVGGAGSTDTVCDPGESKVCGCPDGRSGAALCKDDLSGWKECTCTGPIPNAGIGGATVAPATGGTTSVSTGGATVTPATGGATSVPATGGAAPVGIGGAAIVVDNDKDKDGYVGGPDCNDSNASVHPGATEVCNGFDDNCVGGVDEGLICGTITVVPAGSSVSVLIEMQPDFLFGSGNTLQFEALDTSNVWAVLRSSASGELVRQTGTNVWTGTTDRISPKYATEIGVNARLLFPASSGQTSLNFCDVVNGVMIMRPQFKRIVVNGKDLSSPACFISNGVGGCNLLASKC